MKYFKNQNYFYYRKTYKVNVCMYTHEFKNKKNCSCFNALIIKINAIDTYMVKMYMCLYLNYDIIYDLFLKKSRNFL